MANPKYAASDKPVPVAELVATLSDGTKVKRRIPRMRACNEKDEKGKLCAGHLKRWYPFGDEVAAEVRPGRRDLPLRALQDALPAEQGRRAAHRDAFVLVSAVGLQEEDRPGACPTKKNRIGTALRRSRTFPMRLALLG